MSFSNWSRSLGSVDACAGTTIVVGGREVRLRVCITLVVLMEDLGTDLTSLLLEFIYPFSEKYLVPLLILEYLSRAQMQPFGGFDIEVHHAYIEGISLGTWRDKQKLPTNCQPFNGCFVPSPVIVLTKVETSGMKGRIFRAKRKHVESIWTYSGLYWYPSTHDCCRWFI